MLGVTIFRASTGFIYDYALWVKSMSASQTHNMSGDDCPICWEPIKKSVKIACGHEFCFPCLKDMQARKTHACPLCRADSAIIVNLKTRCPRKGENGIAVVRVKGPPTKKRRTVSKPKATTTIVISDDGYDSDVIPQARCVHCEEVYDLNYLQLHSGCPAHMLCATCAYIPRAIGVAAPCIVCTMHELNIEKTGLNELLASIGDQALTNS